MVFIFVQRIMIKKTAYLFLLLCFLTQFGFSQNWKQIGIRNPADIYEPNPGDLYPYGIGVIWDLKFEPYYDGKTYKRLYATGISSGLWLSSSGMGNDWKLLNTDFLPETSIGDFAIHPQNRNRILIGTGLPKLRQSRNKDLFSLPKGKGVFAGTISKINKVSWALLPDQYFHDGENIKDNNTFWSERTKCVGKLTYSNDGKAIFLAVIEEISSTHYNSYIYRSMNGGSDWFLKATLKNLILQDMKVNPSNGMNIIASCNYLKGEPGHFLESNDEGKSWNVILATHNELNEEGCFYKICFGSKITNQLWICKSTAYSNEVFIRADEKLNQIQTFRQWHNAGSCGAIAVSSVSDAFYSAGSVSLNCAIGKSSQNINMEMHSDIRSIAYYPGSKNMVIANDGGVTLLVFDTLTNSYRVSDISFGLEVGRITNISSVNKKNFGFANWDNSCRWVTPNSKGGHFFDLFGNESTVFELTDNAFLDGSAGPTNATLFTYDSNYIITGREIYYGDFFTFIPHKSKFLYTYGSQLHGVNYGSSISMDSIILNHPQGDKSFLQPRVAAGNSDVIYAATQQQGAYYHFQIFKSIDGGHHWEEYNVQPYGGFLSDIAIDPLNTEKICVGSTQGEVFFSENSGLSFTNTMMPLEAGAVNTLAYINSNWVLAACDYGLWIGNTNFFGDWVWRRFNDLLPRKALKLPACRITDVEYLSESKMIRAATMGRGLFECDVKNLF